MQSINEFFSTLGKGDLAGWTQAVGTILAIFASGWIASRQAKSQYINSLRLQNIQDKNKQIVLTEVVVQIIKNSAARVEYVFDEIQNSNDLSAIDGKAKYYDYDGLTDILISLKQIPLKDLPSPHLVSSIMILISGIRQLQIQVDKAITGHKSMSANDFNVFFKALQQIKNSTAKTYLDAKLHLEDLKQND